MVFSHAKKCSSVKRPPRLQRHALWHSSKQHLFSAHSWQTQHAISSTKYQEICSILTCLFIENTSWPRRGQFWLLPHVSRGTCPRLCTPDEVRSTTRTAAGGATIHACVRGRIWPSPDPSRDICPSICAPDEVRASWVKKDLATICAFVDRPTWGLWSSVKLMLIGWLGSPWFSTTALQFISWAFQCRNYWIQRLIHLMIHLACGWHCFRPQPNDPVDLQSSNHPQD